VHISLEEDGFRVRDLGSTNGTFLDGARIDDGRVPSGSVITVGKSVIRLLPVQAPQDIPASERSAFGELVGKSPSIRSVFGVLERMAASNASVLIGGETGTGKELVARAIHQQGPRANGPFVAVDCGAISANLVESELFGHVRGAFTGATETRAGAFERAHGGVLFLDEIGELPLELQPKLLRALESRQIRKVGGSSMQAVDVRVVAGTHRNLAEMVDEQTFRADLYYRLAVVQVDLPALRDRLEDLPLLVEKLLREAGISNFGPIEGPNLEELASHDWPGNVRELRNALQRALACAGTSAPRFSELSFHVGKGRTSAAALNAARMTVDLDVPFFRAKEKLSDAFEAAYLAQLLVACERNIAAASRRSGITRRHLYDLLKKHGLHG
jgi:DNA-binding NtrC family response regulator